MTGQRSAGASAGSEPSAAQPPDPWVDVWHPDWYGGLLLRERRALLDAAPDLAAEPDAIADEALDEWASEPAFRDREDFRERLAREGLTEDRFRLLLGQPAEVWRDAWRAVHRIPPAWLVALAESFAPDCVEAAASITAFERRGGPLRLSRLGRPIAARGQRLLRARLDALRPAAADVGLDLEGIEARGVDAVLADLLGVAQRTLVLELHVFRLEGRLSGEDSQERFDDFVRQLGDAQVAVRLLREYPFLARRMVTIVDRWVTATAELCERLVADWPALRDRLGLGAGVQRIAAIDPGAGDKHRGGRSVHLVTLTSGSRVVYKPRPMAVDRHFQDIVAWLDARLDDIDLATAEVVDRGQYGWMEFLSHDPVGSRAALARFYERLGALLALLRTLHATDMHSENVYAAGEHPHVIDVEALLHPRVRRTQASGTRDPARDALERSVYGVGLLPRRVWVDAGEAAGSVDISGVGGHGGQYSPDALPYLEAEGTDEMRVVRRRVPTPETANMPRLADGAAAFSPEEFADDLVAGFEAAYAALEAGRGELLADDGPLEAFRDDTLRHIVRPTRTYALRLMEGAHPDHQRDALDYERLLDGLWGGQRVDELLPDVFDREREDLLAGDVPLFAIRPGSVDLLHHSGAVIAGFAGRPGIDVARENVAALGAEDRRRQVALIRASFTAFSLGDGAGSWPSVDLRPAPEPASPDALVAAACAVGDRLAELALSDGDVASWVGLEFTGEQVWSLQPASPGLFSGVPGIALFLAWLAEISGRDEHAALAERGVRGLLGAWDDDLSRLGEAEARELPGGVGAFDRLGGSVYALSHLGALWGRSDLIEEASRLGRLLADGVAGDEELDLVGGSAGCIAVLRSLEALAPQRTWLDTAIACGDRLAERAVPAGDGVGWPSRLGPRPLTGFAHGTAGFAWALVELAALCRADPGRLGQAEDYERLAAAALAYERGTYDPERGNWPDFRGPLPALGDADGARGEESATDGACAHSFMHAWCHGAPGIGLSRVLMADHLDDPAFDSEIEAALETTLREGMGLNHSLCHGTLGNLDLPLTILRRADDPGLRDRTYRLAGGALDSIAEHGWLTGVPRGVETPGLMAGLAGIGWGLLRLAAPDRVPDVLALEPPAAAGSARR